MILKTRLVLSTNLVYNDEMKAVVRLTRHAEKQLSKAPLHIQNAFLTWVLSVQLSGLAQVRSLKSYHDEPLKGKRKGQRSIRLSRQWRVIYETENQEILVTILEVNAHDYR
jgi:toxin HigB-1